MLSCPSLSYSVHRKSVQMSLEEESDINLLEILNYFLLSGLHAILLD